VSTPSLVNLYPAACRSMCGCAPNENPAALPARSIRLAKPSPYREATLAHDFADIRRVVFPGDKRRLMDMRRSGAVEAIAGGADPARLSAKMANSIGSSNALHKTYLPVEIEAVKSTDEARIQGRRKMRHVNAKGSKV
jgi:hypothetical protein